MPQIASQESHRPQPIPAPIAYIGGRLAVDTDAATRSLFTAFGCESVSGTAFTRAWHSRAWLFVHPFHQAPVTEDLSGPFPPKALRQARRDTPAGFIADLNTAGIDADLETIHFDSVEDTFVDADRAVQVLHLHDAPGITEVAWPDCPEVNLGLTKPEPDAAKVLTTWILRPGTYLLVWRFPWNRPALHGAARIEHEPSSEDLADLPGFQARRLDAACDRCGLRWAARDGSTRFELQTDSLLSGPWQYADVTGHFGSAVNCPNARCAGRAQLHN